MIDLPAGPALDRLIAVKVMGWEQTYVHPSGSLISYGGRVITESSSKVIETKKDGSARRIDFQPSRDIAHAWEVVEKLKALEPSLTWSDEQQGWFFNFDKRPAGEQVLEDTAPLAICRAALLAVANA